jgi:thiol-disulfide isomerase/thioredoxin
MQSKIASAVLFLVPTGKVTRAAQNSWCRPCKMLSPILEKLTGEAEGIKTGSGASLDLVTVDTDANVELSAEYKVH